MLRASEIGLALIGGGLIGLSSANIWLSIVGIIVLGIAWIVVGGAVDDRDR